MSEGRAAAALRNLTHRAHAGLTGRAASALWAALRALDLRDQTVLIPANTCYVVLWAVLMSGNRPWLIDIDAETGNISEATLARCPIERPAALIPCHMYGLGAPMGEILSWARARGVVVIEDAALALGAEVGGQPAGSWGDASIVSFGAGKTVDAGGGGALLTDDARLAAEVERALALAPPWDESLARLAHQWEQLYWALHQFEDENAALPALYPQLFALYGGLATHGLPPGVTTRIAQGLKRLTQNKAQREQIAAVYDDLLDRCPCWTMARPAGSLLWRYPLRVSASQRDDLLHHLWARGVHDATCWYPPLRPMTAALTRQGDLPATPGADRLGAEIINLPLAAGGRVTAARRSAKLIERFW